KLTEKLLGGTGALTVFEFKDLDGEGGAAPSKFDEITLQKGKIYDCVLEILNESVSPADNITAEIIAEANDHQFYFSATNGLVSFSNFNADGKGFPLGTTSLWTASSNTGSGTLNITLKHKPDNMWQSMAKATFAVSLISLMISLIFSLVEILQSTSALEVLLSEVEGLTDPSLLDKMLHRKEDSKD
ncbi:MAG: hypothetical protein LW706_05250, partial [Chitinophagaceae bacterium]|nr:hypothetical protein [Chitinophagaceae bacterium]